MSNLSVVNLTPIPELRDYQLRLKAGVYQAWAEGHENVCAISPTGSGKTVTVASIVSEHQGGAVIIAHRQELVTQLSLALNAFRVRHRLITPPEVVKLIIRRHLEEHGVTHYDPSSLVGVGGVHTIVTLDKGKKAAQFDSFLKSVTLWINDEGAHVTAENIWGRAYKLFTNVKKGLAVTAWPGRADGRGTGRHADGLFDTLVLGPTMEHLIEQGFLTPFKIWTIPYRVNYDQVPVGASGEYVQAKLVAAEDHDKKLVGDIVSTYLQRIPGKRAICFLSSIKKAQEVAEAFREAGIPALALDGKTDDATRARAAAQLQSGELRVLTNADLFGEGTDIPAVEAVIMGTRTASFSRYLQWFGRMLRLSLSKEAREGFGDLTPAERRARIAASEKPFGIVLDHAGNVVHHNGPPCGPHVIPSLDARERRGSGASEAIPHRVCANKGFVIDGMSWEDARALGLSDDDLLASRLIREVELACGTPYAATHRCCPVCGYMPLPLQRGAPEQVDGDLQLLDTDALAALAEQARTNRQSPGEYREYLQSTGLGAMKVEANVKRHREKLAAHDELDRAMGEFGYHWHRQGEGDSAIQRRFFLAFGVDVISAKALDRAGAIKLAERIDKTVKGA